MCRRGLAWLSQRTKSKFIFLTPNAPSSFMEPIILKKNHTHLVSEVLLKQYGFLKLIFLWLLADSWDIKKGLLFVAAGCFVKWMVTIYHILYSCRIIGQVLVKGPFFTRRKKNFFYFSFRVGTSTYVLPKYFECIRVYFSVTLKYIKAHILMGGLSSSLLAENPDQLSM